MPFASYYWLCITEKKATDAMIFCDSKGGQCSHTSLYPMMYLLFPAFNDELPQKTAPRKGPLVNLYLARKIKIIRGHYRIAMFSDPIFDTVFVLSFYFIHWFFQQIFIKHPFYTRYSECWGTGVIKSEIPVSCSIKLTFQWRTETTNTQCQVSACPMKSRLSRRIESDRDRKSMPGQVDRESLSEESFEQTWLRWRNKAQGAPGRETKHEEPKSGMSFACSKSSKRTVCSVSHKGGGKGLRAKARPSFWLWREAIGF